MNLESWWKKKEKQDRRRLVGRREDRKMLEKQREKEREKHSVNTDDRQIEENRRYRKCLKRAIEDGGMERREREIKKQMSRERERGNTEDR